MDASKYDDNKYVAYENSKVRGYVNTWYDRNITQEGKTAVSGEMFLLTTEQAVAIRRAGHEEDVLA